MPQTVARVLEVADSMDLDSSLQPRGYRLLARDPPTAELRSSTTSSARYGSLQKVMRATTEDLEAVAGVEPGTARVVKEGLARLAESSILDRYS